MNQEFIVICLIEETCVVGWNSASCDEIALGGAKMNNYHTEKKVLVADDEPEIRRLIRRTVLYVCPKCQVRQASNGLQAKEKLMAWCPQLVILDLHMPHINGLELSQFIQEYRTLSHTKILAVTGYPAPGINEVMFDRGVSEFLLKPFDTNDLAASIRRLLV